MASDEEPSNTIRNIIDINDRLIKRNEAILRTHQVLNELLNELHLKQTQMIVSNMFKNKKAQEELLGPDNEEG